MRCSSVCSPSRLAWRSSWPTSWPDAVGGDVDVVVAGQQPAFLGEQQEHHPHHHGDHAGVQVVVIHPGEQLAAGLAVEPVQRPGQHLHRLADLPAEGLGDFLAAFQALGEQRGQPVSAARRRGTGTGCSSATSARSEAGSSLNRLASHTAAPVVPPRGAHTRAHQRPSVTTPTGTSRARSSTASRSTPLAVQPPVVVRASGCVPHGR